MSLDLPAIACPAQSRHKAAIIVRLLRSLNTDLGLSRLPEESQLALARALGTMGPINRETLNTAVAEFTQALDAMALPGTGGVTAALAELDGQLSPAVAARMTEEAARGDPEHAWTRLARLSDAELADIVRSESVEIAALLVSKLPVTQAAMVLGLIPGEKARRIACTTARIDDMPREAVARIAHALVLDHCGAKAQAFEKGAVDRVGAILNSTKRARRDEVLEGLDSDDPEFAEQVRRAIFTLANIPDRVEPLDVPKVMRNLDPQIVLVALAGALAGTEEERRAAEFMLDNMSKRMSGQLREDIDAAGPQKASAIEEAQSDMVRAIRDAADIGEITLIKPEDE